MSGQPGDAVLRRHDDGPVTVERADPVIRVSKELLDKAKARVWDEASGTLTLDTAGEYRYRHLGPDPDDPARTAIFERIQ